MKTRFLRDISALILSLILTLILSVVLIVAPSTALMAAQPTTPAQPAQPSDPPVLAPEVLALISDNVPAGEYEEFRIVLNHYFRVYQQESLPKQQRFANALMKSLLTSDFNSNVANAKKAEDQNAPKSMDQQVSDAEATVDGPLADAMTGVIQNLLTGTNSDFNHKIVSLAGIYIMDPLSAPAVYALFKTINDQYDNNAAFRGLIIDAEPAQQFLVGLKWAGVIAFAITVLNPRTWPYLTDSWNAVAESWGGLFRSIRGVLPEATEEADTEALDNANMVKLINRIAKNDPARAQALQQIMDMKAQVSGLETQLEAIGYKGAQEVTDSQLLQEAMSNDPSARVKFEERMKENNFKVNLGQSTVKYERAVRLQTFLKWVGLANPRWQFITFMKLMGIASVGGVFNVAGHHMGLQRLYSHVYGPVSGWKYFLAAHVPGHGRLAKYLPSLDFTTRLVPLDSGALLPNSQEPELLNTSYNALAALNFSCNVDAFTTHLSVYNRQLATETMAEYLLWYQFLSANDSAFQSKRCVPPKSGIHYDSASKQIVMSLFDGQVTDNFACAKYAKGISGQCLAVSLDEAYEQLRESYPLIQKLPVAAQKTQ